MQSFILMEKFLEKGFNKELVVLFLKKMALSGKYRTLQKISRIRLVSFKYQIL